MGILQRLGLKKSDFISETEIIQRKNDRIFTEYQSKPNETFYVSGAYGGGEIPYHYNQDGEIVSGEYKSEESNIENQEGFENEETEITSNENTEEITENNNEQDGVSQNDDTEVTGAPQEQESVFTEEETSEENIVDDKDLYKNSDKNFVAEELYLTMSNSPELTDQELLDKFPEFNDDPVILNHFKNYSLNFEKQYKEEVKKKDTEQDTDVSTEKSAASDSETQSTSKDDKKIDDSEDFDVSKFKKSLVNVEASGELDYSLTNPKSSAVGPYQFLYNTHKKLLKEKFGVKSKKEFIGNKEAQEGLMDYMLEDKPGRYTFMAKRIMKDYGQYLPEEMNFAQIVALQHYVGHGSLRKLFARVRDEKDFKAEDVYDFQPEGLNMKIGDYLNKMTPEDEGMYIGMENPLDDPNLTAGGDVNIQAYVSSQLTDDKKVDTEEKTEVEGEEEKPLMKFGSNVALQNFYSERGQITGYTPGENETQVLKSWGQVNDFGGTSSLGYFDNAKWIDAVKHARKADEFPVWKDYVSRFEMDNLEKVMVRAYAGGATSEEIIAGGRMLDIDDVTLGIKGDVNNVKSQIAYGILKDFELEGIDINDNEELRKTYDVLVAGSGDVELAEYNPAEMLSHIVEARYKVYQETMNSYVNKTRNSIISKYTSKESFPEAIDKLIEKEVRNIDVSDVQRELKDQGIHVNNQQVHGRVYLIAHNVVMSIYNEEVEKIYDDVFRNYEKMVSEEITLSTYQGGGAGMSGYAPSKEEMQKQVQQYKDNVERNKRPRYGYNTNKEGQQDKELVFRMAAEKYLKADRYDELDDTKGGAIDYMVEKLWRKYVENGEIYQKNYESNLNKEIEKYNNQFTDEKDYFQMPGPKMDAVKEDITKMQNNPVIDFDDMQKIIQEKHGILVELSEDGQLTLDFSEEYYEKYRTITNSASEKAWSTHNNSVEKYYFAEGLDRSLFGTLYRYAFDQSINPDQGIVYTDSEEIGIGVLSIALDPVFLMGGPVVSSVVKMGGKYAVTKMTQSIAGNVRKVGDALYRTGQYSTRAEANMAALNIARSQKLQWTNRITKGSGYASSAQTLGLYETAFAAVEKELSHTDWETEDIKNLGNSYAHGNVMGVFLHGINSKVSQVNRKLNQYNLHPVFDYPLKGGVYTLGVGVEIGGFTASEIATTGIPDEAIQEIKQKYPNISDDGAKNMYVRERLIGNTAFVFGLRGNTTMMKLVSGNYKNGLFYDKVESGIAPGQGELSLNLSMAERRYLSEKMNPNMSPIDRQKEIENPNFDKDFLNSYMKNLNDIWSQANKGTAEKQSVDFLNQLPLTIKSKLVYSTTGMGAKVVNEMDAYATNYETKIVKETRTVDGKEITQEIYTNYFKNQNGDIIGFREYTSKAEMEKHLKILTENQQLDFARGVVEHGKLDLTNTENLADFQQRLNDKNLTIEQIESILNKEKLDLTNPKVQDAITIINEAYKFQKEKAIAKDKEAAGNVEAEALQELANKGIENPSEQQIVDAIAEINNRIAIEKETRLAEETKQKSFEVSEFGDKTYVKLEGGEMVKGPFGYTMELGKGRFVKTKDGVKEGYTSVEKNVKNPYKLSFEPSESPEGVMRVLEQMVSDKTATREEVKNIENAEQLVNLLKEKGYDGISFQTMQQKIGPYVDRDMNTISFEPPSTRTLTEGTFKATKENIDSFVGETTLQNKLKQEVKTGLENGNLDKVNMHTDKNSFADAFKKEYPNEKLNPDKVEGFVGKDGTVHFNMEKAGSGVGFHETGHKIVNKINSKNPDKVKNAANEIIELLESNPELVGVKDFIAEYKDKEKNIEALVELSTRIAKGEVKVDKPGFTNGLKKIFNKLLDATGLGSMKVETMNAESARSLVNEIANTLKKGDKSLEGVIESPIDVRQLKVNINPNDIKLNTSSEVDRVVSLDKKAEDGATFNLDGTKYDKGGLVIPVVSENLKQSELTPERIAEFVQKHSDKIGGQNVKVGIYKFPNKDQVSIDLNIVTSEGNREIGLQIGKALGQESLFDLKSFENVKTGGTGDKPMELSADQFKLLSDALKKGQVPEFLGGEGKTEYTLNDIVNKGKGTEVKTETTPTQDFKSQIKTIKQNYKSEIKKIKDGVKNEKDAVKKVKNDLLDYINTSPNINKTLKTSLVKESIKVDTPKKLERFIDHVETIADREALANSKRDITSLINSANKRSKKGEFGNQSELVNEFLSLDISEVTDMNILGEYNKIVGDLNRPNQPLVMPDKIKEVTDMVNKHMETITPKETKPLTLQQVDKKLNENIQDIGNLTIDNLMDLTSLDGVNKVKSVHKRLSNLEKQITKAWEQGVLTEDAYLQRMSQVNQLNKALEGTVTQYNTEVHNISKGILSQVKIEQPKTSREREQLDYFIKNTSQRFIDNPMFNDQLLTVSTNMSNGFLPIQSIIKLNNQVKAMDNGSSIISLVENRVDRWGGQKVYGTNILGIGGAKGQYGFKDVISLNVDKLNTDLAVRPLSLLSDYYRSEAGQWKNKDAGSIDKYVVEPFLKSFNELTNDVQNTRNNWAKVSISNTTKIGRRKNIKLGMILSQLERNQGDGANVIETIINNPKKFAQYSKEEQRMMKRIYESLPKVDGKIDVEAAISNLSSKERKALEEFQNVFNNDLMEKQKYANQVNGLEFIEQTNYFPHLIKGKKSELNTRNSDWMSSIFDGEAKIKSDAGKERTTSEILPYEFNINKLIENRIVEVNRDYHLSETINSFKSLMLNSKLNSGEQYHIHYDALMKRMKDAVELQLTSTDAVGLGFLNTRNLMQANYHLKLLRPGRLATEFFSENFRMLSALERGRDLPQMFTAWSDRASTNMRNISGNFIGLGSKERYVKRDGSFGTTMENLMDYGDSPFMQKFNRHDVEYSKELGGRPSGYISKVNNYLLGLNDRNTMHMAFMPAFRAEFKRLSGKEFNSKEFNTNEGYRNQYENFIKESIAIGNREAGKWKNIGVKGAGRTEIRIPFGTVQMTGRYKNAGPLLTYMGSFGALEAAMYQKGMRDMMIGESLSTRANGLKQSAGIFSAGVSYGIGTSAEYLLMEHFINKQLLNNELQGMEFSNENDRQKFLNANNEILNKDLQIKLNRLMPYDYTYYEKTGKIRPSNSLKTQTIGNAGFLMTTKYSQLGRTSMILTAYGLQQLAPGEQDILDGNINNFLWNEMASLGITKENIGDFVGSTLYSKPTGDISDIAASYLPHIENMQQTVANFGDEFFAGYNALFANENTDGKKVDEFIQKNKEKFAVLNMLNQTQKMLLMLTGTQLAGQKMIDGYVETQFNIFNIDPMAAPDMQWNGDFETFDNLLESQGVFGDIFLEQMEEEEGPLTIQEKIDLMKKFQENFGGKKSGDLPDKNVEVDVSDMNQFFNEMEE